MSESSLPKTKAPLLGDRMYKILKQMATVILPALGTLYFTLAQVWHFPNAEQVVGTIVSVNTFVGVVLGISTVQYNNSTVGFDGALVIGNDNSAKIELYHNPDEVVGKSAALFKVENEE